MSQTGDSLASPIPHAPYPMPAGRAERTSLRLMQIGAIAVVVAVTTFFTFELDRFFVPKELALHLTAVLAGLFALRAFRRTIITPVDVLLFAYLLLGAASAAMATNRWLAIRALAITASGLVIFWAARALRQAGLARPLVNAIAVAVVLVAVTSLLQTYGVETELFSEQRAPGGTLGNRNFVAHVGAFGLPIILLMALRAHHFGTFLLSAICAGAVTATLVLSRSRAAWLAFAAVAVVFVMAMLIAPSLRRSGRTWFRLVVVVLLAGGGVAAALLIPNALRWRSDNPYLESLERLAEYQEGSGRGRLIHYERSLRMALGDPLLGVGPGNWAVVYPDYAARRDPSMNPGEPGTTFNPWPSSDWVAWLSERGVPAVILLGLVFLGIALHGLRQLARADDLEEAMIATALLGTIVAAGVVGAFDAVLMLALPAYLVWAALGALWTPEGSSARSHARPAWATLMLIVAIGVAALGAARSGAQLTAMQIYATNSDRDSLELASRIDPGNYRLHLRLARMGRRGRCDHALAARSLYPNARAAVELARGCGD